MVLVNVLQTKPVGPYFEPPHLHVKVLLEVDRPKVIKWEFSGNSAKPKVTKSNKAIVISDGKSIAKITIFEDLSSKICRGQSYIMKGYSVRGGSPPFALIATRETAFFRSSPVNVDETLMREATDVLWPHSILTPVAEIHNVKGLLTVEGNIVQVSYMHLEINIHV
ncbi:hypothetical protein XENORESO_018293 [Xenotaenia resolanae]|uniref:Uncharacterized protein n=1 Tax=Xenotaenia resolanae TaxID=208358 RepID=A0ABV0W447_9TELE